MIGAGNHLVESYERKVEKAKKAESEARASYVRERKNADSHRRDSEKLALELKSSKEKLDNETARLRASRDSWVKVEQEKTAACRARIDRLRKKISDEEAVRKDLQMLAQITGTRDCLEELRQTGVPIPDSKMEKLAADEKKWRDLVYEFDIIDLLDGDLEEPAPAGPTRDTVDGADGPSGAAADGGDRAPTDQ